MKKQFVIFGIIFLFLSCSKKEDVKPFPFDEFVFSSSGLHHAISMKFTKSDTVYFKRIYPEPVKTSYAILEVSERKKISELYQSINFEKFNDVYEQENLVDGTSYLINILKEGKRKQIFLYGHVAPQELEKFIDSLGEIKRKFKFLPTVKIVDFGNLKSILPPSPPPILLKRLIENENL
ncbi:DUF6438 domain-containing protein [Flavobacterium defluvii]|uniref:DUF6438 domain-containing protein n=1 Tax=Flavobacterium defluvii TaxID=370979 RepID=A0A1M5FXG1_9FLAO|nr:hypothetical protein [Flavobacterium defluvii]SHF96225.1 hypothetical protein SAMN05443663_101643 [Flavobacterium defluvii]